MIYPLGPTNDQNAEVALNDERVYLLTKIMIGCSVFRATDISLTYIYVSTKSKKVLIMMFCMGL